MSDITEHRCEEYAIATIAVVNGDLEAAETIALVLRVAVDRDTEVRWDADDDPCLTALSAMEMGAEGWCEIQVPFFGVDAGKAVREVAERLGITVRVEVEAEKCCFPIEGGAR